MTLGKYSIELTAASSSLTPKLGSKGMQILATTKNHHFHRSSLAVRLAQH